MSIPLYSNACGIAVKWHTAGGPVSFVKVSLSCNLSCCYFSLPYHTASRHLLSSCLAAAFFFFSLNQSLIFGSCLFHFLLSLLICDCKRKQVKGDHYKCSSLQCSFDDKGRGSPWFLFKVPSLMFDWTWRIFLCLWGNLIRWFGILACHSWSCCSLAIAVAKSPLIFYRAFS